MISHAWLLWGALGGTPAPQEILVVHAGLHTTFHLMGEYEVNRVLTASVDTSFALKGDHQVSITQHLTFFRGEDITLKFQMVPPQDITGWTISWKMADALAGSVEITKSATITDGPKGKFEVAIASADTASETVGRHVWDCRRTDSGNKSTLADGFIDLKQEVTA